MRLRRTKPLVFLLTASVLVAVGSFVLLDLWWRYERAIGNAEARATTLSRGVSEYVRGTFALADTSLRQLAIHGQRVGGAAASAADWMPILEAAQAGFPGSGSLSVTDAQGVIRHSTLAKIVGQSRRVELHGGTMTAASEGEGRGATFRIVLPVRGVQGARFDDEMAVGSGSC